MRELINRIRVIEAEQKRRYDNDTLSRYNAKRTKIHKKQLAFHRCKKRNRWVFGGNRSGKTECGAVECVYMARGIHPYRKNRENVDGWVVSVSQQVQRDVAQKKLLYYLNPDWIEDVVMLSGKKGDVSGGVIDYIAVRNVFGGISRIGFKSCDQGREKFQGASLDFVWFDEEPPRDVYDEARMRVFDKCGDIFGTMTPLKGLTFLYDEIYLNSGNDPEVWYVEMQWEDNPFLSKKEIAMLSASIDERTLSSRKYGKFDTGSGLVYPEFDVSKHVIEPFSVPREWYDAVSIDPGLKNPLSAHFYACDYDGNVYVIAEHYASELELSKHANAILATAKSLDWHFDAKGRLSALIDSAANQRTLASVKSVSELFGDYGILVNTNVNKDVFSGISRVKDLLTGDGGKPSLYVFKNCVNMIREFKSYYWGNNDAPVKRDDHAMDELRYYIMTKPKKREPTNEVGELMRYKEMLAGGITRKKISNARKGDE